jgi:class 3 adenylate cyclase
LLQALLQHNHVIKQAADDNIGCVLEQEGDSFTLAFHDPHDAAAFALQVGSCKLDDGKLATETALLHAACTK